IAAASTTAPAATRRRRPTSATVRGMARHAGGRAPHAPQRMGGRGTGAPHSMQRRRDMEEGLERSAPAALTPPGRGVKAAQMSRDEIIVPELVVGIRGDTLTVTKD